MLDIILEVILLFALASLIGVTLWAMIGTFKSDIRYSKLRMLLIEDECKKRGISNE